MGELDPMLNGSSALAAAAAAAPRRGGGAAAAGGAAGPPKPAFIESRENKPEFSLRAPVGFSSPLVACGLGTAPCAPGSASLPATSTPPNKSAVSCARLPASRAVPAPLGSAAGDAAAFVAL